MADTYEKKYKQISTTFNVEAYEATAEGISVDSAGNLAASGYGFFGVAHRAGEAGDQIPVIHRIGDVATVVVGASQTISKGDPLTVTTAGQTIKAVSTNVVCFDSLEDVSTGAGETAIVPVVLVSKYVL